jgi:hypothetical protein
MLPRPLATLNFTIVERSGVKAKKAQLCREKVGKEAPLTSRLITQSEMTRTCCFSMQQPMSHFC